MCLQKNRASPNFAQSELARLPNFLYLRESSQDIPKIMFKSYTSNDNLLLPPCLGDFIPQNDPVRVVHRIIEQINLEKLYRRYSPQGCSAYHPRMMLQILVYAYLRNIYSSRRIEEFCRNDIRFMWLTGNVTPDHNTINRFRSSRLKDVLKTIFATIVKFLVAEGFVSLDVACTDGTKMEADANRYTFVWGKSIHTRISRIAEQLEEIWQYAESVTKQELRDSAPITYQDITPEKVEKALCQIDDALNGVDADRKMKAKVRRVRKSWPEQLRKYESQGKILDGRNSYSKTDNDATFMRMKEDAMRNGQTKPGYNLQIGTENQFITDFALFPNPTDTLTLIPFLQSFSNRYDRMAHTVVADSGYGSEENYRFMSENGMEAYVKYNYFHMEQRPRFKPDPFKAENFYYNEEHDFCICPMGQRMRRIGTRNVKTASGYVNENARYRAVRCEGCPLRCRCFKAKGNRTIELNHRLRQYKRRAKELLCSEKGLKHRGQRCIEPEAVFGQIKNNMNYKRFRHFGKDKVFMDFAFLAIAFNIKKMCAKLTKKGMNWLIRLFYELTTAVFRCWEHINQRNLQKIAA